MEEIVIVVASLPGESETDPVEFSLVGAGPGTRLARIEYSWPSLVFDINTLFGIQGKDDVTSYHPKIVALKKDLQATRDHIDEGEYGHTLAHLRSNRSQHD